MQPSHEAKYRYSWHNLYITTLIINRKQNIKFLKELGGHNTSKLSFEARLSITSRSPTIKPTFLSENQSETKTHKSANIGHKLMIIVYIKLRSFSNLFFLQQPNLSCILMLQPFQDQDGYEKDQLHVHQH